MFQLKVVFHGENQQHHGESRRSMKSIDITQKGENLHIEILFYKILLNQFRALSHQGLNPQGLRTTLVTLGPL